MKKNTPMVIEMLRNWYFIDSVLLNNHAKYAITEKNDYEEYLSLKSALLSNLQELYQHTGYAPLNIIPENHKQLQEAGRELAKISKNISARMLENSDMKSHIKKVIHENFSKNPEADVSSLSDKIITERFTKMCLDNMLIGKPLLESKNQDNVNDFRSQILEQSYLTIRRDLIKIASKYRPIQEIVGGIAALGFMTIGGFSLAAGIAKTINEFSTRCNAKCSGLNMKSKDKKICELNCKIATQKRIIAALRKSAAETNNIEARTKFAKDVRRAQLRMTQYQRKLAKMQAVVGENE